MKICMICDSKINEEDEKASNLPLYVIDSEGLTACLQCRIIITDFIRSLMRISLISRKNVYKELKDGNKV